MQDDALKNFYTNQFIKVILRGGHIQRSLY